MVYAGILENWSHRVCRIVLFLIFLRCRFQDEGQNRDLNNGISVVSQWRTEKNKYNYLVIGRDNNYFVNRHWKSNTKYKQNLNKKYSTSVFFNDLHNSFQDQMEHKGSTPNIMLSPTICMLFFHWFRWQKPCMEWSRKYVAAFTILKSVGAIIM